MSRDLLDDVVRRYGVAVHPEARVTVVPQGQVALYVATAWRRTTLEDRQRAGRILGRKKKFAALAARYERDGA